MRKKYLIITGVKLLISQWHVNGLIGILSKPTFNLQLTQSSTLQLITILPIYYSVIILRKGRNRKIFYILNHWVFRELRKKWFRRKRRKERREKGLGAGCSDGTGQGQPKSRDSTQFGLKGRGKRARGRKLEIHKVCGALHWPGMPKQDLGNPSSRTISQKWIQQGRKGGMNWKSSTETNTLPHVKQTGVESCCVTGSSTWCSATTRRGGMGREEGGRFKREGTHVHLRLTHTAVGQKPTQHCKAIICQLQKKTYS